MHRAALREITRRQPEYAPWDYVRVEVPAERLSEALPLLAEKGFYGLNLTLPHKVEALRLVREVDPEARRMGAVNTLVRDERGGYRGYNTDGYGLRAGLYADLEVRLQDRDVLLLGAGGASRAAAVQCLKDGCRSLWIGNRTESRLQELLGAIDPDGRETRLHGFALGQPPTDLPEDAVIINATSSGLKEGDVPPVDLSRFSTKAVVYDMIYNPAETVLMKSARERGLRAANGLSMLVFQGARSLEIWTQQPVSVEAMSRAAQAALGES